MKKFLIFSSVLLLTTTTTFTGVEVKSFILANKDDLQKIIKIANLGSITPDLAGEIPNQTVIENQIKKLNPNVNLTDIQLENLKFQTNSKTKIEATVVPKNKKYHGKQNITFIIPSEIKLGNLISNNQSIGTVETRGKALPTASDIMSQLQKMTQYKNINWELITIKNPNSDSAILVGDQEIYCGSIQVHYFIDPAVALSDMISQSNITSGFTNIALHYTETQVIAALLRVNQALNQSKIQITDITENSAIVKSTDPKFYTGQPVTVNFSIPLNLIINQSTLPDLNLPEIVPTADDIKASLKASHPDLNLEKITVTDIRQAHKPNSNYAYQADVNSLDQDFYSGKAININFNVKLTHDLTKIITKTDLGTISVLPPDLTPNEAKIISIIHHNYPILDNSNIEVKNITKQQATIIGKNSQLFIGQVIVSYHLDQSVPINTVITKLNLGDINTNGCLLPNQNQIKDSVKVNNPNAITNSLAISEITNQSATLTGDGVVYSGSVKVNFTIINQTISQSFQFHENAVNKSGAADETHTTDSVVLLNNWKQYASTWAEFEKRFHTLAFGADSELSFYVNKFPDAQIALKGNEINFKINEITEQSKPFCVLSCNHNPGGWFSAKIILRINLNVWHDDNDIKMNVYWSCETSECLRDRIFTANLQNFVIS